MGPIDYNIQPANLLGDLAQGFQLSQGLQSLKKQQDLQGQYKTDLQAYSANPTAQGAATLALKYPQQREAIKQSWDTLAEADRTDQSKIAGQVYAALNANRPDIAQNVIQRRINALTNSNKDATAEQNILDMIGRDPSAAKSSLGLILANINDPKSFATQFTALGKNQREESLLPTEQAKGAADAAKAQAEADIKQVEALNARTRVGLENESARQNILNSESTRRIQELNTQIAQANSETQRGQLILERDKLIAAQGEKTETKQGGVQSQLEGIDRSLQTIDAITKSPGLDGFFMGTGTLLGKVSQYIPGSDRKDLQGLVDTLTSQQFLTSIKEMQGMGALSDAEGKRIASAVATLDLDMSPKAFKNALGVVRSTLEQAKQKALASRNLPTNGGAFVIKSPTYGDVREGQINKLLQQYPGTTREQVMQFLGQSVNGGGLNGRY